jgi:hypothetical protein
MTACSLCGVTGKDRRLAYGFGTWLETAAICEVCVRRAAVLFASQDEQRVADWILGDDTPDVVLSRSEREGGDEQTR